MLSRKIIYSVLIISSVFFYILFVEKLSFYLMVFLISLPFALLIILLFGKLFLKYSLSPVNTTAVKKSNCNFKLDITNKTIFPFPTAVVKIKYKNKLSENSDVIKISVPIHSLTSQSLKFSLASEYCGIVKAEILYIRLYDYLKLFSVKVRIKTQAEICVVPDVCSDIIADSFRTVPDENSMDFSKHKSGDDPSEIFELKDYIAGDKLNRIHWNLSSKQNQLITKHYSLGVDSPVAVISDLTFNASLPEISTAAEILYTISFSLIENEIRHELYIKGISESFYISDYVSLNEFYANLLNREYDITKNSDSDNQIYSKAKIFLVTNKPYETYEISEIPLSSEMKCLFVGNYENDVIKNQLDNISISLIQADRFESMPADIFL